jgi:hypothetical protein
MDKILCSVATRGRYDTTLPLVLEAILNQTVLPHKLCIYDDNDDPIDVREKLYYKYFFQRASIKGVEWEWNFAHKKGQHHIHQMANTKEYDWVWRCDDDAIPEPNVLETLRSYIYPTVGAIGGSILTPPNIYDTSGVTGLIDNIDIEPNIQWGYIQNAQEVEHLHCSFLYRAGKQDYNLGLSRVAHREETLFTGGLHQKGYKILAVPNAITWHLKNPEGGIRSETNQEMYQKDDIIFNNWKNNRQHTIVVLNSGLGDHIVFNRVLPFIANPLVFTCYPEIVSGKSIAEAQQLFGDLDQWSIYKKMAEWNWKGSLEDAYRKLYL